MINAEDRMSNSLAVPLVSIVIVAWNARQFTHDCLRSLDGLTLSAEIIVVDNASTDGTPELVQELFPHVILIRNQANLGFAKANNIGIARSRGRYIGLVNSDVTVLPNCLERLVSHMEANPSIGVAGPQMLGADGRVRRSSMRVPTLWNNFCRAFALDALLGRSRWFGGQLMTDFHHNRTRDVEVLNGWFWLVRRKALEQVGVLDERFFIYGEDIDWCQRFRDAGWRLVFYADASSVHYGGASSAASPIRFYIEMQRANFGYWQKHRNPVSRALYCCITLVHQTLRAAGYSLVYCAKPGSRSIVRHKIKRSLATIAWLTGWRSASFEL
jgi:GT2 family glycosyltransferase